MREELLKELEAEYADLRLKNERTEIARKEEIRRTQPEIYELVAAREELVFGTLRAILEKKEKDRGGNLPEEMEKLSGQIREKLQEKGYAPDYLAPVYRCPLCQDRGYAGEPVREMCACMKKAYQAKLRERAGLAEVGGESFETFDLNRFPEEKLPGRNYSQRDLMRMSKKICEDWANRYPESETRDLLLVGNSGLGKTFLLRCMARRLIERGTDVMLISAYRLLEICRKNYFGGEEADSGELLQTPVLMIDDLGSEPLMQNVTVEQLFYLLNERQSRGLATVVSTNLMMNDFRKRYTERIASRLLDSRGCRVITLEGKDIRTEGAARE